MSPTSVRRSLRLVALIALAVGSTSIAGAQAPARPSTQKPPARPAAPAPAPAPVATPAAPPRAVAQDLRFKTVYTTGDQRTETVSFQKSGRERFEFADMVVLKQPDLKRTVQISRAANSYLVVPDGQQPAAMTAPAAPQTPGVVVVTTTIVDTGERKQAFGLQARHVKTTIDRQPQQGACDPARQRIEIDGWYVDVPTAQAQQIAGQPAGGCVDEIKATHTGDPKVLGFPIAYAMTMTGEDGKPNLASMEVSELEVTTLDAALFEVPPGLTDSGSLQALSRAVSDANEVQLAKEVTATPGAPKAPGTIRIGVPEFTNKTTQQVDTRALRAQLIAQLQESKIDAEPLPAGAQPELLQHAAARSADFLLVAEVTELKVSKGGGLGGLMKAASSVAGGAPSKDPTEAAISIKLVQPDGKTRVSTNAKGKDGGFDMKAGLGVAKFAGSMYLNVMSGRLMFTALKGGMAGNLQGMGLLGNPALFKMQAQGLGFGMGPGLGAGLGARMGMDSTAGAASFLMQQAMAGQALVGLPGQPGPSFDAALEEALKNAAKAVSENVRKR
jgi:hypothetical protein